jgi:hypothetical protein
MSNMHQLLIREGLRDGGGLLSKIYSNPREMVGHHIYESIDRLYRALRKLQQLQKQIQEKQKKNLEHRTYKNQFLN